MKGKLGATLFALLFAIPFGGVGAFAAWGIASMAGEARRADDWVIVQARVDDASLRSSRGSKGGTTFQAAGAYAYSFGGKSYVGTQLGFSPLGGSDNIGDWQESMAAFLEEARKAGRSVPVFVNPDNPSEAVVDREIRWALVLFLGVFAVVFGGVGVGALVALGFIWRGTSATRGDGEARNATARAKGSTAASNAWKGAGTLWLFTFFWNAISFPIAYLVVGDALRSGEWVGFAVLLFPLLGVLLLWGAIASTIGLLRRGKAALSLEPEVPKAGSSFSGSVSFSRGVKAGEAFKVRLVCNRTVETAMKSSTVPAWSREVMARAEPGARGMRVAFRFEVPADVARTESPFAGREQRHAWRIELGPSRDSGITNYGFDIEVQPAPAPAFGAGAAFAPAAPEDAPSISDASLAQLLGRDAAARLSEGQRASFAQLPPDARAMAGKFVRNSPAIRKAAIAVAIVFVVIQVVGVIAAVFASP